MRPGRDRRTRRDRGAGWITTYSDLMSLLVVLFVYVHVASLSSGREPREELPRDRIREGSGWAYLGRIPLAGAGLQVLGDSASGLCARIQPRIAGGRSRIALVGFAPTHEMAFEAARSVRGALAASHEDDERFLLVSGGGLVSGGELVSSALAAGTSVEVYATEAAVGPPPPGADRAGN